MHMPPVKAPLSGLRYPGELNIVQKYKFSQPITFKQSTLLSKGGSNSTSPLLSPYSSLPCEPWFLCSTHYYSTSMSIHSEKMPYYLQSISSLNTELPPLPQQQFRLFDGYIRRFIFITLIILHSHDWSIVQSRASLTCLGRKKFRANPAQCGPSSRTSARFNNSQPWLCPRNACRHI